MIETQEKDKKVYKVIALTYLKKMDFYFDFIHFYNEKILESYRKLVAEARLIDRQIRDEYIILTAKINSSEQKNSEDLERQKVLEKRYESHTILLNSLIKWNLEIQDIENPEGEIKILKEQNASKVFSMYSENKPEKDIIDFIEIRLADVYHKILRKEP